MPEECSRADRSGTHGERRPGGETCGAATPLLRIARFGRNLVVVFGAREFVFPFRLRLFHTEANRFAAFAYRVSSNPDGPDGSTLWTTDAFSEADLRDAAEHIPSLRIIGPGCPTAVEVGDADLAMLVAKAKPPRQRPLPWLRPLGPASALTPAVESPYERPASAANPVTSIGGTPNQTTPTPTAGET